MYLTVTIINSILCVVRYCYYYDQMRFDYFYLLKIIPFTTTVMLYYFNKGFFLEIRLLYFNTSQMCEYVYWFCVLTFLLNLGNMNCDLILYLVDE